MTGDERTARIGSVKDADCPGLNARAREPKASVWQIDEVKEALARCLAEQGERQRARVLLRSAQVASALAAARPAQGSRVR
jgi:hypothetical protein